MEKSEKEKRLMLEKEQKLIVQGQEENNVI